ncbi:3-hydroxyisobutyrate dehydrogenase [Oceanisphaera psychrotolerans]|uniref:3-hydroxyisobutyrate dehydrogenase n=1 Tax=Oceanisphaera psychrotolerans TaxID=1414654 RepID=A0A1J4QIP8_9GAMM|nr:3-hydroxyisobutyrate dehydrogenase [Oceanisphaera psychrotolerans]OIN12357.1 3-hydroxyisobutyrate dehydrogenase [Oceanisphaera psychrotolerans]
MASIAFIGLGNMGSPMVVNLLRAGHRVRVYDLQPEAVHRAAGQGAMAAGSAAESVQQAEVVITMLQSGTQVDSLYVSGPDPLFDHLAAGTLVIDCSTIDAATARATAAQAMTHGLEFIDAPVSGGVAGAEAGTLTFIVGGTAGQFARAEPILSQMGQKILHAGEHGAGQIAKACNNMLLAVQMAGTCEALNMGVNNGLDPKVLSEIIKQSSGNNWVLQLYNPVPGVMDKVPASRGYQGGFQVRLMCKDLNLAMELSQGSGSPVPMGSAARALFNLHQVAGFDELDFSSLLRLFRPIEGGE